MAVWRRAFALSTGALALGLMCRAISAGEVVVYSTIDPEEVQPYKTAFEGANPGITLNIVRSSAGTMTARILAEKDNPRHDVMFRIANTSLIVFGKEGMLHPYEPKGLDRIHPQFRDKVNKPAFRKRMLDKGDLEATGRRDRGSPFRPAELYRYVGLSALAQG